MDLITHAVASYFASSAIAVSKSFSNWVMSSFRENDITECSIRGFFVNSSLAIRAILSYCLAVFSSILRFLESLLTIEAV
jgi:hypothetical protein